MFNNQRSTQTKSNSFLGLLRWITIIPRFTLSSKRQRCDSIRMLLTVLKFQYTCCVCSVSTYMTYVSCACVNVTYLYYESILFIFIQVTWQTVNRLTRILLVISLTFSLNLMERHIW